MAEEKILNYLSVTIKEISRAYPRDPYIIDLSRKYALGLNTVPYKIYEETRDYLIKYQDNILRLIETRNTDFIVIDDSDVNRSPEMILAIMTAMKKYINDTPNHKLFERILDMLSLILR